MNWRTVLLCTLLFAADCSSVSAQTKTSFLLKKVQIKGLPSEAFYSTVEQDSDGFIWIATISGLYRYDGSRVIRFVRDPADTNSLTHNYAKTLAKDARGNIWIGTYGGFINLYERHSGRVKRIEPAAKNQERVIVMKVRKSLTTSDMVAAGPQCIYKINSNGRVYDSAFLFKNQMRISDFLEYEPDKFLITADSLFVFDWKTKKLRPLPLHTSAIYRCIEVNADGSLCLGTDAGVLSILPGSFSIKSALDSTINDVQCLRRDKKGRMWIGTPSGVFIKEGGSIQKLVSADTTIKPLNITDIFLDKNETAWIATGDNGLYQAYQPPLSFNYIKGLQQYSKKSTIQSVLEEAPGSWLIGTTNGLFRYALKNEQFEKIILADSLKNRNIRISYQLKDKKNGLWIATTHSGIFYRPAGFNKFLQFKFEPSLENSIPSNNVTALQEDNHGRIWIGTYNGGTKMNSLCYYDPVLKLIERIKFKTDDTRYFNASNVSQVEKKENSLWIGSWDDGLYRYPLTGSEPPQDGFINYSESGAGPRRISHDVVSCVEPGNKGKVWFGTVSGGLNVLDTKTDSVHWYTIKDGLASNLIYRIEEDEQGIVWISTDNGISRFDPGTKTFINYHRSSGLPSTNFAFLSSATFSDGTIVFGTSDGQVVYFNPKQFTNSKNIQPVVVADIRLANQSVQPAAEGVLTKSAYMTETIRLNHDQNDISFDLANMDFINPENFTYAYKLDGFDKEWIYITDRNSITYTNLDPGFYTLLVKNANHQGVWNEIPTKLVIIVNPPYWETWWFRSLVILALASGIYLLFRYRLQQKLKIFAVRQRLHRDLHDDVGATLSSVKVYTEILGKNGNNEVITGLIKENATEMMERLEVISWATNPQHDNFNSLKNQMIQFASPLCHSKNIAFSFKSDGLQDRFILAGEIRQNIFLIFKEAINNMAKYAEATACETNLCIENHRLILQVKDNGKGFDGTIKGTGHGRKNMEKRAADLKGKLSISSSPENGTLVLASLPL